VKVISIRQPGYLPYLGFFKKIESVDVFVFLDDVQYSRGDWDNRNKIRTSNDSAWLTVPILSKPARLLNQVKIDYSKDWLYKHKTTIKFNYENSPFFDLHWKNIESIFDKSYEKLLDLNMSLIDYFLSVLQIKTETILSSTLDLNSTGSKKLLDICKLLDADTYLSGELGKNYLDKKIFQNANIKVVFEKFCHPVYNQNNSNFLSNLSIIDLLFNEGPNSIEILKNSKNY